MTNLCTPWFRDKKIAQDVRRKDRRERTREHLEWISIDCRLHPEIYEAGFEPLVEHDLQLNREDLYRLMKAPRILQHAFGFITNDRELRAHSLLHRYYQIKIEDKDEDEHTSISFGCTESEFVIVDIAAIGNKLISLQDLCELPGDDIVPKTVEEIGDDLSADEPIMSDLAEFENISLSPECAQNSLFVLQESVRILEQDLCAIDVGQQQSHSFVTHSSSTRKLAGFRISIVLQGTFVGDQYKPGHISASLCSINAKQERVIIGESKHFLQVINCDKNLGRLLIGYEPGAAVEDGKFEIAIRGFSACKYSLIVMAKIMVPTKDHLLNELNTFRKNAKAISQYYQNIDYLHLDKRILERKMEVLGSLGEHAEQSRREVEDAIDIAEYNLESNDLVIAQTEVESSSRDCESYFAQSDRIKDLEKKYARCCRILMVRKELIEKTNGTIDNILTESKTVQITVEDLEQQNKQLQGSLSQACQKVCDDVYISYFKSVLEDDNAHGCSEKHENTEHPLYAGVGSVIKRSRACFREIERVRDEKKTMVESCLLHALPQLFPKETLLKELDRLLNNMIHELIGEEEASHPLLLQPAALDDDSFVATFDSDNEIEEIILTGDERPSIENSVCRACDTFPCEWKSSINYNKKQARREELTRSILKMKKQRLQHISKVDKFDTGGNRKEFLFYEAENLRGAIREADHIDDEVQLYRVDKELHDAYNKSEESFFVTRALHRYECLMDSNDAICALEREQERLVAKLTAGEVVSDVLDWMDRGWYFGQPSEKEGRRSTTLATQKNCSQQDRIKTIHRKSSVEHIKRKVTARTMQNIKTLDRTERNVKMCLFSLTLRYFQAYNLFRKQKLIVCGNHDLIGGEGESIPTMERIAMEEEESNARTREQIIKEVNSKALRGYHRMHLRREYQQSSKIQKINDVRGTFVLQRVSSILIQKYFRGHIGRKAASTWKFEIQSVRAWNALCHASAIAIARYWRGYWDRAYTAKLKMQLTNYIIEIRRAEMHADEDEYWNSLKFGKYRRARFEKREKKLCNLQKTAAEGVNK